MITVAVSGLKEMIARLGKLVDSIRSNIESGAGGMRPGDTILHSISNSIDAVGLKTRSTHLKKSFSVVSVEKTSSGIVYRIASSAPYAMRLNDGGAPTSFYTPSGIVKRIVGNRPYHYLDKANIDITAKLSALVSRAMDKALVDLEFK